MVPEKRMILWRDDNNECLVYFCGRVADEIASLTLFEAMEAYLTKGITTEILAVFDATVRSAGYQAVIWDYHLHMLGYDVEHSCAEHAKGRVRSIKEEKEQEKWTT